MLGCKPESVRARAALVSEDRFSRQIALFGREGQERLAGTKAAIVGLGGVGSHIAQQLALAGVEDFLLIDNDVVSESNLNRLIGATPGDVGREKVMVAEALIMGINPSARVQARGTTVAAVPRDLFVERTVVFGCVDHDRARLQILDLTAPLACPYFDIASDVLQGGDGEPVRYGGQVVISRGAGCLACRGLLNQDAIRVAGLSEADRDLDRRIYGVDREVLNETGPSVVTINGVVASLATTEFLVWATRLREPRDYLVYRAWLGIVNAAVDPPEPGCYYCDALWGSAVTPAQE